MHSNIKELHERLKNKLLNDVQEACIFFNCSITSWGRSILRNRTFRGSSTSWHLDWLAIDATADTKELEFKFIKHLQDKGYRVKRSNDGANHVQYNWPIVKDFDRIDIYSHLSYLREKYPTGLMEIS